MERVTLGMTGLRVSPIAFGTWQIGGEWGEFDREQAIAAIREARRLGINLFDTAQGYGFGASERILGEALREDLDRRREEVVIATKGGLRMTDDGLVRDSSPEWLREGVEASLDALGVERIDIYQVHWPDNEVPFAEAAAALQDLVEQGRIAHVGVSNFDAAQIAEFARTRPVETLQPPYHLFRREIEAEILPYAAEHEIGVLIYSPLAHGLLSGAITAETEFPEGDWRATAPFFRGEEYRRRLEVVAELRRFAEEELGTTLPKLAIAWTLAHPAVHVAIAGARRPHHIAETVEAAELSLGEPERERIEAIVSGAASLPGPYPEMMPES